MATPIPIDAPDTNKTTIDSIIEHIASTIAGDHFPNGDRAALRRLGSDSPPSLAFYRFAFKHLPDNWEGNREAWQTLVAGIALMCSKSHTKPHRRDRPVGQVLAEAGYSEKRLERLLAAEGETLHTLLLRAVRFLAAKNETCNWVHFAYLLSIYTKDKETARLTIARYYYKFLKDNKE